MLTNTNKQIQTNKYEQIQTNTNKQIRTNTNWVGISDIEAENKYVEAALPNMVLYLLLSTDIFLRYVYASDDQELTYTNFRPGYPIRY